MLEKKQFYIDGHWVDPHKANDYHVINPANEDVCAVISLGDDADTNAAVAAAKTAFSAWAQTSKKQRKELVQDIYNIYKKRFDDMAQAISLEMGAPIDLAQQQQTKAGLGHIKTFLNIYDDFTFEKTLANASEDNRIFYEPIGVCGLITPWNWPMNQVTLKVIPALLAGCTMVLKPSEIAPLSSLLFAEIIHEAGVPNGVFNLVNGDGDGVGAQLSGHRDIDMISFTGSTRAGIAISKNAAPTLKRVHLELGGKGANIIFNDCDDEAIERGILDCFGNSGQSCNAPTRMLVQRDIYDKTCQQAIDIAQHIDVDSPQKQGDHLGPVVSKIQYDKIQHLIQKGIDEGANLLCGGVGRADKFDKGYYVKPTIFADVDNDMTIAREEIFGPVLSIIPFDDEAQAVEIANDTIYGLTNYIQTQDKEKASRIARQMRSGMVEINGQSRAANAPFGGMKASGNGREGGVWGIEDFLEIKSVSGLKK